jgi:hypothetical protein
MWSCAVLTTALLVMCCDMETELSPALRRSAYGLLALVLLLDAIGSVVWGNPFASDVSFSVTDSFSILLDNQLTSCVASQVVIALHFVFVSFRSRRGRGWAYASLRFELDECGQSILMSTVPTATNSRKQSGATASAATPMLASDASAPAELQPVGAARWSVFSRLRQRWLQFQQRQVSRCRVFVIPCVAVRGAEGGGEAVFALARPAFDWRWLRLCTLPLQRLADAHLRFYAGFMLFFLALPSLLCSIFLQGQAKGVSTLVLNSFLSIMALGFMCSQRYVLDRVAVKHVALSFRFAIMVTLLTTDISLSTREVYTIDKHPTTVVANALTVLLFCLNVLLDCSPHLPLSVQFCYSVNARKAAFQKSCLLIIPAGRMVDVLRI